MNLTHEQLRALLERAWQMGSKAASAGCDEQILMDTEIESLIDEAQP